MAFVRGVGESPNLVVAGTPDLERTAVRDWLERFDDQPFSLADAVSFAVMDDRGIREALTLDHRFAVAGFVMVPARRTERAPRL
jgi:predicted nucleic acid-binding protein